jgi:hypothetical protein
MHLCFFAVDNIFVDNSRMNLSSISPIINGLSDHDAQILTIKNVYATTNKFPLKQRIKLIDNETIMNFQTLLKKETWESVFNEVLTKFACIYKHL